VAHPDASALLASFVSLITLEIGIQYLPHREVKSTTYRREFTGLFGITMCRVLMQYRTTSGRLLSLLMRHNILYFAAGVGKWNFPSLIKQL